MKRLVRHYYKYKSPEVGYRELRYVTGSEYLDVNYYPSSNTVIQAKFIYSNYGGYSFIGKYTPNEVDTFRFFRSGDTTYLDFGSGSGYNRINGSLITSTTKIYEIEFGNRYVKDLETGAIAFNSSEVSFGTKSYSIGVFYSTDYGTIYYLKIFEDGTLQRDLVPCKRMSDGVVGLYDKKNGVFYGNSNFSSQSDYIVEEGTIDNYDYYVDRDDYTIKKELIRTYYKELANYDTPGEYEIQIPNGEYEVHLVGAGGGAAKARATTDRWYMASGTGGSGAYWNGLLRLNGTYTLTIGAGGTTAVSGWNGTATGTNGGATSISNVIQVSGGTGSVYNLYSSPRNPGYGGTVTVLDTAAVVDVYNSKKGLDGTTAGSGATGDSSGFPNLPRTLSVYDNSVDGYGAGAGTNNGDAINPNTVALDGFCKIFKVSDETDYTYYRDKLVYTTRRDTERTYYKYVDTQDVVVDLYDSNNQQFIDSTTKHFVVNSVTAWSTGPTYVLNQTIPVKDITVVSKVTSIQSNCSWTVKICAITEKGETIVLLEQDHGYGQLTTLTNTVDFSPLEKVQTITIYANCYRRSTSYCYGSIDIGLSYTRRTSGPGTESDYDYFKDEYTFY